MPSVDVLADPLEEQIVDELLHATSTREDVLSILGGATMAGVRGLEDVRVTSLDPSARRDLFKQIAAIVVRAGGQAGGLLLSETRRMFPGKLPSSASSASPKETRAALTEKALPISILLEQTLGDDEILEIVRASQRAAASIGKRASLDLVEQAGLSLSLENGTDEETDRFVARIRESIRPSLRAEVQREAFGFRDYFLDPIFVDGPDGQRFSLDHLRASTPLADVARGVMEAYEESFWPMSKGEKATPVLDLRRHGEAGVQRLFSRQTLHEAGVRPFDLVEVHPERRAGSVNPFLLTESLTMVKNQILEFARTTPGFEVQANSVDVPTEYLVRFVAPGFAPPLSALSSPRRIDEHEVLLVLPADFPVRAPSAFFQREVFHPNVDRKTGLVCLGVLAESYRPGLHFGTLCQMLIDMASYRNYELREGYDMEAAAWAASEAGQSAIAELGGRRLSEFDDNPGRRGRPLRYTRLSA